MKMKLDIGMDLASVIKDTIGIKPMTSMLNHVIKSDIIDKRNEEIFLIFVNDGVKFVTTNYTESRNQYNIIGKYKFRTNSLTVYNKNFEDEFLYSSTIKTSDLDKLLNSDIIKKNEWIIDWSIIGK